MTLRTSAVKDVTHRFGSGGGGHISRWQCMGCQQYRSSNEGSRGAGIKKRCAQCVRTATTDRP